MSRSRFLLISAALVFFCLCCSLKAQPSAQASSAFVQRAAAIEGRLGDEGSSLPSFLTDTRSAAYARLHRGEIVVEQLTPTDEQQLPGAILHHWRGSAFIPGASAPEFELLLRRVSAYSVLFAPQVIAARVLSRGPDRMLIRLRVRQTHVVTVVMDASYAVTFSNPVPGRGASTSRSTRISEIEAAGTARERTLSPADEHGFLWRSNTYWTWQQRDGGLYLELETLSLTRSVPPGLGWAVRPFVQSVPRDSIEFTLRAVVNALRK